MHVKYTFPFLLCHRFFLFYLQTKPRHKKWNECEWKYIIIYGEPKKERKPKKWQPQTHALKRFYAIYMHIMINNNISGGQQTIYCTTNHRSNNNLSDRSDAKQWKRKRNIFVCRYKWKCEVKGTIFFCRNVKDKWLVKQSYAYT